MSVAAAEKMRPSSSSSVAVESSSSPQLDPLLKDLSEKKQSFRRSVVSLATELKDVRNRLATQEESVARETLNRQVLDNAIFLLVSHDFLQKKSSFYLLLGGSLVGLSPPFSELDNRAWLLLCDSLLKEGRRVWKRRSTCCRGVCRRKMGSCKRLLLLLNW